MTPTLHSARPQDLDVPTVYRILQLRVDVFVVEQACAYPELDGRDLEPDTTWVWAQAGTEVLATLRILREPDGRARIGRVAVAVAGRSRGLAGALVREALTLIGDAACVLDAQSYLAAWYERFGFRRNGPDFIEDGIAHQPMSRAAAAPG